MCGEEKRAAHEVSGLASCFAEAASNSKNRLLRAPLFEIQ